MICFLSLIVELSFRQIRLLLHRLVFLWRGKLIVVLLNLALTILKRTSTTIIDDSSSLTYFWLGHQSCAVCRIVVYSSSERICHLRKCVQGASLVILSPLGCCWLEWALVFVMLALLLVQRLILIVDLVVVLTSFIKSAVIWYLSRLEKAFILWLESHDLCLLAGHIDTLD